MELQSKVRIKDIAERAGVSVGTVDRVIHGRTNVSKASLLKVQKVLDEINYVPNHYASALASNKTYNFAAILPMQLFRLPCFPETAAPATAAPSALAYRLSQI